MGLFTLMPKKPYQICQNFGKCIVAKILATCQNFGKISYIVTIIWQQTKYSHFFGNFENGIKVNRPYMFSPESIYMPQPISVGEPLKRSTCKNKGIFAGGPLKWSICENRFF
jgi:hypothetical protein